MTTDPALVHRDAATAARTLNFTDDGVTPNNPDLPVLFFPDAIADGASSDQIEALYRSNGWHGTWTATVFDYEHYHPDAHEVLTVASGSASLRIGGRSGKVMAVNAGDVLMLPGGIGHMRLDQTDDFAICGGYPPDQPHGTIIRAPDERNEDHIAQIAALSRPESDPVFGEDGPLVVLWGGARE